MGTTLLPNENRILTELFVLDQGTAYGFSIKELDTALNSTSRKISPRDIAIALGTLRSKGLTTREEHESGDWLWSITPHGTEIFTGLSELEYEAAEKKIPAADRYVNSKDNQPEVTEIRESVAELIKAIRENRSNEFDDKEGRLGELLALDLLLSQPQISVPFVEKILNDTVRYLAKAFADNAIGTAAQAVVVAAAQIFLNGFHP